MSSVSGENSAQQNFNPSWMRQPLNRQTSGFNAHRFSNLDHGGEDFPMAEAVISKYSYNRDEMLSLAPKDSKIPDGLLEGPIFTEVPQWSLVDTPLSDLEQKLQHNVNSSKAMSSLSHSDRAAIAAGNAFGGGYSTQAANRAAATAGGTSIGGSGWTSVKPTWSKGTSSDRPQRGITQSSSSGRGGSFFLRGSGRRGISENALSNNSAPNTPDEGSTQSPFSKPGLYRRGGGIGAVGRGGSTSAVTFNSRAEGLYNPNDPTDRPKVVSNTVTKSESDDEEEGGWLTVGGNPHRENGQRETQRAQWGRSESWGASRSNDTQTWGRDVNNGESAWKDRRHMMEAVKKISIEEKDPLKSESQASNNLPATTENSTDANTCASDTSMTQSASYSAANPWSNSMLGQQIGMYDFNRLQQQQQYAAQMAQAQAVAQQGQSHHQEDEEEKDTVFHYMDPSQTLRGPFTKEQMVTWFKAGYFSDKTLRVKRGDGDFRTIGELVIVNGQISPFDYPEDKLKNNSSRMQQPQSAQVPLPQASHMPIGQFPAANPLFPNIFGGQAVWGPQNMDMLMYQSQLEQKMAEERQRMIEEHNRKMQEETERIKSMHELMMQQLSMEQELQRRKLQQEQDSLQVHREQLARREAEMKEKAFEIQKRIEGEKIALEKRKREMEKENSEKAAEEKKLHDALIERKRQEEAENLRQKELNDKKRRAEEAAEIEKKRLEKEAEKAAQRVQEMKMREEARKLAESVKVQELLEAQEKSRRIIETESAWAKEEAKPKLTAATDDVEYSMKQLKEKELVKHTKTAPWAATKQSESQEKTLREIQLEEERQLAAEQQRLVKQKKADQAVQQASSAAITSSIISNGAQIVKPKPGAPVWGTTQQDTGKSYVSPLLDGPSLAAANKIATTKKVAMKPATVSGKAVSVNVTAAPKPDSSKTKSKTEVASDALLSWFEKKFKTLHNNKEAIDVGMLFSYVLALDNPNEVEDIVMSYLDESKTVKEFVREFIKRRIAMRSANAGRPDHDDLSSARNASAAPSDTNSSSNNGACGQGKKKKKNGKTVLDNNILGFRGAAASDRLNKGEIDAVPTTPTNPSRR